MAEWTTFETAIDVPNGSNNGYLVTDPPELVGGAASEVSCVYWINLNTVANNRRWQRKGGDFDITNTFGDLTNVTFIVGRATTDALAATNDGFFSTTKWWYVVCTFSEAYGPQVYHGDESTDATEATYGTQTFGSGDPVSTSGVDLEMFYRDSGSNLTMDGACAYYEAFNRRLTFAEVIEYQKRPPPLDAASGVRFFPGADGNLATLTDLSGNGNNAARQGAGQTIVAGPTVPFGVTAEDVIRVEV